MVGAQPARVAGAHEPHINQRWHQGRCTFRRDVGAMTLNSICVVQHVEAEFLGLMEDHLEGRGIRFQYFRPFTAGGRLPDERELFAGLVLLGGGPFGVVSGPLLPSLAAELRLAKRFLDRDLPVIGIGIGAVLLAVAAGGGAAEGPLRFGVEKAHRNVEADLSTGLPDHFPVVPYLRDRPIPPSEAITLAFLESDEAAIFSVGTKSLGFLGHPGIKSGMIEDLIIEFEETPPETPQALEILREQQVAIAESLSSIMRFIINRTGWMSDRGDGAAN